MSVLDLLESEAVTVTAGVPTVWMTMLQALDAEPDRWDLSQLRLLLVGGSAVPRSMLEGFDRHGLTIVQAWGMTETSPLGSVCRLPLELDDASEDERYEYRARQGRPTPFVEIRARGDDGELIPWDDESMGELEVRGPWVARAYHQGRGAEKFSDDGWFSTGDVVKIDATGNLKICDRSKDLVKSGGEWISSVDLENLLMAHEAVAEAAVIAIPDDRWGERPLAVVVVRDDHQVDAGRAQGAPGSALRQMADPRALRVHRRDPAHGHGQVQEDRAARDVHRRAGVRLPRAGCPKSPLPAALAVLSRDVVNAADGWSVSEAAVWLPGTLVFSAPPEVTSFPRSSDR